MEKKYQYSKFLGENREEQVVIRADNWEEFKEAANNIGVIVANIAYDAKPIQENRTTQTPNKEGTPTPVTEFEKTCQNCGGEKILNPKTGKMFCKAKCWLK